MSTGGEMSDEELLSQLADAAEIFDPVPPEMTRFAQESRRLIELEAELAELAIDADGQGELVGVRDAEGADDLRFVAGDVSVSIRFDGDDAIGSIHPFLDGTQVMLQSGDERRGLAVTAAGLIRFKTPRTMFRLLVEVDGSTAATDWVNGRYC